MTDKEKQLGEYEPILKPIPYDEEHSAFNLWDKYYLFDSMLVIEGRDRMIYTLSSCLPTKAYGKLNVKFMYVGTAYMQVKTQWKTFVYEFNKDIFLKHIIIYIKKHIHHWRGEYAFGGLKEVVDFYNAVLTARDTVENPALQKMFDSK